MRKSEKMYFFEFEKIQNFGIIKKQVHTMHILNVNTVNFAVNRKENDIL